MSWSRRRRAILASAAFVVLTVLVASGGTDGLDAAVRELFRPDDVWGPWQVWTDRVVEAFQPITMVTVLGVVALSEATRLRSRDPLLVAAGVCGAAGVVAVIVKFVVARRDPHGELSTLGGAYPSGHVLAVVACLGGVVLVLVPSPRSWWWALVGASGALMTLCLLMTAAHSFTDAVGGALVATAALAWVSGSSSHLGAGAIVSWPG